jgi:hypothetical protein
MLPWPRRRRNGQKKDQTHEYVEQEVRKRLYDGCFKRCTSCCSFGVQYSYDSCAVWIGRNMKRKKNYSCTTAVIDDTNVTLIRQ